MQPEKTKDENKGVPELTMIKEFRKLEVQQGRNSYGSWERLVG
jgi:hypothetical protein